MESSLLAAGIIKRKPVTIISFKSHTEREAAYLKCQIAETEGILLLNAELAFLRKERKGADILTSSL